MAIDLRSIGQSTAPQTPRISINGEARISISELGQVIFVTAHSLCTEITRSPCPSCSFYKPSSITLDLGLRTREVTGISFMYKGRWGLRVKGHVEIIWRGEFSSHADSKYKLIKTFFWEKYRASAGNRTSDHLDEMAIDLCSIEQSTAPQTPRISINGEVRILGRVGSAI